MPDKASNKPSKIEQLKLEIEQLTDALKRERADVINIRRRSEEDRLKLAGYYKSMIVESFLPVIDNFERSLKHMPDNLVDDPYMKGISSIIKQFEDTLSSLGVKKIETVGKEFDPHFHEAVSMEGEEGDKEIITDELQSGYQIDDQVIRHAMVKVKRQ